MALSGPLGVRHAALECSQLARSSAFYMGLGMQTYYADPDWAMFSLGDTYLSLVPVKNLVQKDPSGGSHPAHLGLVYSQPADIDALHSRLKAEGVRVGKIETHRDGSYGFYCADPDGNNLECIFIPHRSQTVKGTGEAWLLLAHGSADARWAEPFEKTASTLRLHVPSTEIRLCFLEAAGPKLDDALREVAELKIERVKVIPLFLSGGGGHMLRDVPLLVAEARRNFPHLKIACSPAIGESTLVQNAIVAAVVRSADSI